MKTFFKIIGLATLLSSVPHLFAQSYSIDWHEVSGNSGMSSGGVYSINGTTGQPGAGLALTAGNYSIVGGFWSLSVAPLPIAPPAGLAAWWRAENNALDAIGANNGMLRNGVSFTSGEVGRAFSFDGVNDYVEVVDAPALQPLSYTLEAWVMFNSTSGIQQIIGKALGGGSFDTYSIWLENGNLKSAVQDNAGAGPILSFALLPVAGQWYHVAYTFDNSSKQQTLYLNGGIVANGTANKTPAYDNHPVLLGADLDISVTNYFLNGRIDEASIYNRALSSTEIASVYNAGSLGKQSITTSVPTLTIRLVSASTAMVLWPSPSSGFSLQQNSDLKTISWISPSEIINDDGTNKFIIVNPPAGNRYYRLFKP